MSASPLSGFKGLTTPILYSLIFKTDISCSLFSDFLSDFSVRKEGPNCEGQCVKKWGESIFCERKCYCMSTMKNAFVSFPCHQPNGFLIMRWERKNLKPEPNSCLCCFMNSTTGKVNLGKSIRLWGFPEHWIWFKSPTWFAKCVWVCGMVSVVLCATIIVGLGERTKLLPCELKRSTMTV